MKLDHIVGVDGDDRSSISSVRVNPLIVVHKRSHQGHWDHSTASRLTTINTPNVSYMDFLKHFTKEASDLDAFTTDVRP